MVEASAVVQALERRNWAVDELVGMKSARQYGELHRHWSTFLLHINGALEKIKRVTGTYAEIGKKISDTRSTDPLMVYLKEARNEIEHGLSPSVDQAYRVEVVPGVLRAVSLELASDGESRFRVDRTGFWHAARVPDGPVFGHDVHIPLTGQLRPVPRSSRSKGSSAGQMVPVPGSHLGKDIAAPNAFEVAALAVSFVDASLRAVGYSGDLRGVDARRASVPEADEVDAFNSSDSEVRLLLRNEQGLAMEKRLDALDLESLIEHLSDLRSKLLPQVSTEFVPGVPCCVVINPAWRAFRDTSLPDHPQVVALRHPGLGWLAARLPDHEAINLSRWMTPAAYNDQGSSTDPDGGDLS